MQTIRPKLVPVSSKISGRKGFSGMEKTGKNHGTPWKKLPTLVTGSLGPNIQGTRTVSVPGSGGPNIQGTRTVPVPGSGEFLFQEVGDPIYKVLEGKGSCTHFSVFSYRACAIATEVIDIAQNKHHYSIPQYNLKLCYTPRFKSFGT